MNKIKVSKEIAKHIDEMLNDNKYTKESILMWHCTKEWEERCELNKLTPEEMALILMSGYELEKTPEEELVEFYLAVTKDSAFENGVNFGIKYALDKLNIKIEGINA